MQIDQKSEKKLVGVHPHLIEIVRAAAKITAVDFIITEGPRTLERQRQLVASGASQTLRSRHIPGGPSKFAHAIDVAATVAGQVRWDWPLYDRISVAMKQGAQQVGFPVEWGGDWTTFKDGPHYQLPWSSYPI